MTPAPNPRAWAVARELAAEAGLDWAAWARGETLCPTTADEMRACGWAVAVHNDYRIGGEAHTFWLFTCGDKATCGEGRTDAIAIAKAFASANGIEPVPAPWDADAYRADCARRGVEPGSMPSLEYDNPTGYGWCVVSWALNSGGQRMFVQMLWCGRLLCTWTPDALQFVDDGCCHREHAAVFVGWATAAARSMGVG